MAEPHKAVNTTLENVDVMERTATAAKPSEERAEPNLWLVDPQPQDLILTLLADNVHERRDRVWSGGLVRLLDQFGFSAGASRVAFSRLARRDLISRVKEGRQVFYRLTDRTEQVLRDGNERIFGFGRDHADADVVTILWHNLPEQHRLERGRLARRLRFNGFGSPQDGTWIAIGERQERALALVEELEVTKYVTLLRCEPADGTALDALVTSTWDFEELDTHYRWFVDAFDGIDPDEVPEAEAFFLRTQAIYNFRQFLSLDPEVDGTLRPEQPARRRTIALFHDLYESLRPAAHRYFDDVTRHAESAEGS